VGTIIVLFNLKPGVDRAAYERWARDTDLPIVNGLESVDGFEVLRTAGLLSGGAAPYQYVEIIRVNDMQAFGRDLASDDIQRVAAEYRDFADAPLFIASEAL
jgi:REDY-like protein HapK